MIELARSYERTKPRRETNETKEKEEEREVESYRERTQKADSVNF